jgi:hypothetical protein
LSVVSLASTSTPGRVAAIVEERPAEQQRGRVHILSPRRIAAFIALVLVAVRLRRHFRYARDAFKYRRQLKFALTVLLFLRQLRKS